jgi:hypothetical protein
LENMIEVLKKKRIVIYGTGHVGHKFYKVLKQNGLEKQIVCFARTGDVQAGETLDGTEVHCFEEIPVGENMLVCLAVHESLRDEIEEIVRQKTKEYVWIYPHLYDLMLGMPKEKGVELAVETLLRGFRKDLRLGVRLAAIEQQDGINDFGFDCYIRAQMLHCSEATAAKRLKQFMEMIERWKQSGYDRSGRIAVTRRLEVIDGNHRLAMAVYTGQRSIYGDIYPTELSFQDIHGCEPMQTKDFLLEHGFTSEDVQKLERIQKRYVDAYGIE